MSIPLLSIMAMFIKVENWRIVNFLPKCTRVHEIVFQNFPGGDTPDTHPWERDTPSSLPLGASRLDSWASATRSTVPLDSFILPLKQTAG